MEIGAAPFEEALKVLLGVYETGSSAVKPFISDRATNAGIFMHVVFGDSVNRLFSTDPCRVFRLKSVKYLPCRSSFTTCKTLRDNRSQGLKIRIISRLSRCRSSTRQKF